MSAHHAFIAEIYRLLGMPGGGDPACRFLEVGTFAPLHSPELVKRIAGLRARQLSEAARLGDLSAEAWQVISELRFHTYEDFVLSVRHETPTRKDGVRVGDSLERYTPDEAGYREYLRDHAPDLHAFLSRPLPVRIEEAVRQRHTYIAGKSGSGKSELLKLLLHAYLKQQPGYATTVVLDPHGDLVEEIARWRRFREGANGRSESRDEQGESGLVYVDPFLDSERSRFPVINPLEIEDRSPDAIDAHVQALMRAFQALLRESGFTAQMEAILYPCLWVLIERGNATLADFQRFMIDEQNHDLVAYGRTRLVNPQHRHFFAQLFHQHTYRTTKLSLATQMQSLLNTPAFSRFVVGKSTLNLDRLLDSRKTILFNLASGKLGEKASTALGIFLLALIARAIRRRANRPPAERVPVHAFIDEVQLFVGGDGHYLREILEQLRKYGLHLTLAQQYLGQGADRAFVDSVSANVDLRLFGRGAIQRQAVYAPSGKIDAGDLAELKTGQFLAGVGSSPFFRLDAPDFLIHPKPAMREHEWQRVARAQLARYYTRRSASGPEPQLETITQEQALAAIARAAGKDAVREEHTGLGTGEDRGDYAVKRSEGDPEDAPGRPMEGEPSQDGREAEDREPQTPAPASPGSGPKFTF